MSRLQQRIAAALARRAAATPALRAHLEAAAARWAARGEALECAQAPSRPGPGPLAALVARLGPARSAPRELELNRRDWAALRLERRLAEPLTPEARQLGPLHPQALVPRALQQLNALSPDYLQRLLEQLDGLAGLAPLAQAEPQRRALKSRSSDAARRPPAGRRPR